jgi:hypothetical protein
MSAISCCPKKVFRGYILASMAFVGFCSLCGQKAVAEIVPGTVSTDPFDSTQGTVVVNHDTIIDPINAFRTSGGFEDGHTLMRNGGLNSVSFIEFDTASPVSIVGVRLFAHNDLPDYFRRAMNHFKLLADTDNDSVFETVVVDVVIDPWYGNQPGNNATDISNLDLTLNAPGVVRSRHWRLEVTQGTDFQPYEGARLVELDAIAAPTELVDIDIKPGSDPNSINLKSQGVLPVAILSTDDYDALDVNEFMVFLVDPAMLEVASILGEEPPMVFPVRSAEEDVDGDGVDDLLLFFSVPELVENGALGEGSEQAALIGEMYDGTAIEGYDSVRIVPGSTKGK